MPRDGPIVGLRTESRPESLTTVRAMLAGVAEPLEMDAELLDDLKTAVSEACNNVILHAYDDGHGPGPLEVRLFAEPDGFTVVVCDEGAGLPDGIGSSEGTSGIGVSVIRALAAEARFSDRPQGGTEVAMRFPPARDGVPLFAAPPAPAADVPLTAVGPGEIAISLSPISLLTGVLGRLSRTLAASAHFSLDRFSDVYLVTDALAAHAGRAAVGERVQARIGAAERRLDLSIGPFRSGSSAALAASGQTPMDAPLAHLADEVTVRALGADEALDVVIVDHRR